MTIFDFIEEDNFDSFKDYISKNPNSLLEKDTDNWSVISLLAHYNMPEYIDFILPLLTQEEINQSTPLHPLFVALEDRDYEMIRNFSKEAKFDLNLTLKNNENIVHYLIHRNQPELALEILQSNKIKNPFSVSEDGRQLLNLVIEKGYNSIVEELTSHVTFSENFNQSLIFDSVKYKNIVAFEELYPYFDMDQIDQLFNYALQYKNLEVVNYILNSGDVIPGKEQIIQLIDLISFKYEDESINKASQEITDFLFSIKTNFNSFANENSENIWILAIKNNNDYLFDRLINENHENLNFEDGNQHTPLFFAIESLNVHYVKKILERKGNPNHTDYMNNNALTYAMGQEVWTAQDIDDKYEIIKSLLDYRADFNHINKHEESALSLAIHKKQMNLVALLLWKGASLTHNPVKYIQSQDMFHLNAAGSFEQMSPIIEEKTIDNFIALKQLGFSLSQKNENGDSFAMFFIKEGYHANFLSIFNLLNEQEVNEIDNQGNSLLMNAIKKKNDDFALKLLFYFKDLDLDVVNKNNETVYDLCADFGNAIKMEALLNNDIKLTPEKIRTALPLILKQGNIAQFWNEFIATDPSLINFKDNEKNNLFMLCASNANFKNIDFLFSQGIQYSSKDMNTQKQSLMDILVSLPEEHEQSVSRTLDYLKKSLKKKP